MTKSINVKPTSLLLAHNSLWSLAGIITPVIVAVILIPLLIRQLGLERFGLLALIWMGVGYFSLFDLGLSKALTQQIATRIANDDFYSIPGLFRTSLHALLVLGFFATLTVGTLTPWLVASVVSVPESMHDEARWSFWILALSLPAVLSSAGLAGVLEGYQRFSTLALIRIPLGISNFAMPVIISFITPSLVYITLALVASRFIALAVLYTNARRLCFSRQGKEKALGVSSRAELIELLHFGGWITVSNIVGPVLIYFDRFFLSALIGLSAVAYYVTPYEIITRMTLFPQAIMAALFPAMAQAIALRSANVQKLAARAGYVMILSMIPLTFGSAFFAKELMMLWLDPSFAQKSYAVVQFISAGVLVNVFARVPFTALQSAGRANYTAKMHLLEVVPYLLVLWWAIGRFGIAGAAIAWLLRVSLDSVLLWIGAIIHIPLLRKQGVISIILTLIMGPSLLLISQTHNLFTRGILWFAISTACAILLFKQTWPLFSSSHLPKKTENDHNESCNTSIVCRQNMATRGPRKT